MIESLAQGLALALAQRYAETKDDYGMSHDWQGQRYILRAWSSVHFPISLDTAIYLAKEYNEHRYQWIATDPMYGYGKEHPWSACCWRTYEHTHDTVPGYE
jgi:hypothetical protein